MMKVILHVAKERLKISRRSSFKMADCSAKIKEVPFILFPTKTFCKGSRRFLSVIRPIMYMIGLIRVDVSFKRTFHSTA